MQRSASDLDYTATEEAIARYAKALSHPVRIRILQFLGSQACCFTGQLTKEIPLAQSTISQHLKELKDAGLIQGDVMPPRVKYCLNKSAMAEAEKFLSGFFKETSPAQTMEAT